ncbi:MAG: hypothetical protein FVQ79_00445 [Planctomycetes bacterium]|nr:hypothetical protein [Planctomycetota bacterium]
MPELPLDKPIHVDAKEVGSCYQRLEDATRMIEGYNDRLRTIKDRFIGPEPTKEATDREVIDSYQALLIELGRQVSRMNQLLSDIEDVI